MRSGRTLRALCLALALLALSAGVSSATPSKPRGVGAVTRASGIGVKVNGFSVDPGGKRGFKGSLRTLYAGDVVTVAARTGWVEFSVRVDKRAAYCKMNPNGSVEVSPPTTQALVDFEQGKSFCGTDPNGTKTTMTLGSHETITMNDPQFTIEVGKGRKVVKVVSGLILVKGTGGAASAVVVGRNQKSVIPTGKPPGKPTPAGPLDASERVAFAQLQQVAPASTDVTAPTVTGLTGPPDPSPLPAAFAFEASETRVTFSCSLDGAGFRLCQKRYTDLAPGRHTLVVRATDEAGNTGPPRSYTWTSVGGGTTVPAGGGPLLGVKGSMSRFQEQTGQDSTVGHVIVGWDQGLGWGSKFTELFKTLGKVPLIGLGTRGKNGKESITPRQLAQGAGDGYLIALNAAVNEWGQKIYIRPFGEMNGYWNVYCAFTKAGTPKRDHSTADFRKAFARVYLIVHGGPAATINAKLKRLGMPPVKGDLPENPMPDTRVVWNPQGYGAPDIPANSAQAYYPGDAYVDVVGNDLYDQRGKAEWDANEALYNAHPNKPYAFPEWGLWGIDDPNFVLTMGKFVRAHKRTEMLAYFESVPGSIFDLATKPKSRAAYRKVITTLAG